MELEALETRKRSFGQDNPDSLASMAHLSTTYLMQGKWTEAEELLVHVVGA